jgi:predicted RNA-binding protein YlxR (DUF448 family)
MLRFVLGPDRLVVPDLAARLPGRGFWLSPVADVVEAAISRGAFARAARGPVTLPANLIGLVRDGLTRRVTDILGLARRAGQAVGGYAKAREALQQGRAGVIIQASDGSDDECHRLLSGAHDIPSMRPLTAAQLGSVFGRDHVVHVAVAPGRLAESLKNETFRLASMIHGTETKGDEAGKGGTRNDPAPRRRRGVDRTDG